MAKETQTTKETQTIEQILTSRKIQTSDKFETWTEAAPFWFPEIDQIKADPKASLLALADRFGAEEILAQVLAQLIISFRAASRTHKEKLSKQKESNFSPSSWEPNLAKLLRSEKTTNALADLLTKAASAAAAQGISLADYLALKGINLS